MTKVRVHEQTRIYLHMEEARKQVYETLTEFIFNNVENADPETEEIIIETEKKIRESLPKEKRWLLQHLELANLTRESDKLENVLFYLLEHGEEIKKNILGF